MRRLSFRWLVVSALAAVVCLGAAAPASAQFGVRGGLNISKLVFDPEPGSEEYKFRSDLVGGVFFVANREGSIGAQIEALYSRRGSAIEEGLAEGEYRFSYFEVPVLARIRAASFDAGQLYLLAGPSFGFNLTAELEDADGDTIDLDDSVESFDFAIMLGVGADFGRIAVDGRYMQGLMNINTADSPTVKNRTLMFTVGVYFN